jgi:hypothetical protein
MKELALKSADWHHWQGNGMKICVLMHKWSCECGLVKVQYMVNITIKNINRISYLI